MKVYFVCNHANCKMGFYFLYEIMQLWARHNLNLITSCFHFIKLLTNFIAWHYVHVWPSLSYIMLISNLPPFSFHLFLHSVFIQWNARRGREARGFLDLRVLENMGIQLSLMGHLGIMLKCFLNLGILRQTYAMDWHAGHFNLKFIAIPLFISYYLL